MNIIKILAVAGLSIGVVLVASAQANSQTFRDSMGRNQGTATRDNYG